MRRTAGTVTLLVLLGLWAPGMGVAQTVDPSVQVRDVSVDRLDSGLAVRIKMSGPAPYHAVLIDSPTRLVIDVEGATSRWQRRMPLAEGFDPIREVRGSQWKPGISRVVVELTRAVGVRVEEGPEGLVAVLDSAPAKRADAAAGPTTSSSESTRAESKPEAVAAGIALSAPAAVAASGPAMAAAPAAIVVAQVQQAPAPGPPSQAPNGSKLISMDFKNADVVNLLRILAAESGRNIVAGEDVKGRVSITLRNVTWEQALDTILEVAALSKVEKDGVIRVVSLDQLAKEREAQARVEEARRKAEIETRTKEAEAQLKEQELAARRLAAEAAAAEAQARGPLREESIRLSYADPEEVAKTLQGILGIPPEGTAPVISAPIVPTVLTSGPAPPPIAEPPFSQLYGPSAGARPAPVSISQDVLAKGITIRPHKPTNTIFIRHYESDVERIKKLVREQLDIPLPQVKIEARMEILDRNALEAIGIQWGGNLASSKGRTSIVGSGFQSALSGIPGQTVPIGGGFLQPSGEFLVPVEGLGTPTERPRPDVSTLFGIPLGSGNLVNLPIQALPNAAGAPAAAGIAFGIIGTNFNINLALQALATQGKTRTLARPEIVTVENYKASMSLGEEIPYATVSSAGTQIQFKEALLKLEVTPTVILEQSAGQDVTRIKMVVVVENNSRGDVVNLGSGGAPPAINRRKAETQVLVKEGERLVIGGVSQSVQQATVRKVPLFGDIPVLGWLFKQKESFGTDRELVVFVTPSILRAEIAGK
jgi:type IV pilus assembly protein PilQ